MGLQIELPIQADRVISAVNMHKLRDEFLADRKMALVMLCESHEALRQDCIRWMSRVKALEQRVKKAAQVLEGID